MVEPAPLKVRRAEPTWGCSFCGLMPAQVEKIVVGPGGMLICNRCVDVCVAAISGENDVDAAPV